MRISKLLCKSMNYYFSYAPAPPCSASSCGRDDNNRISPRIYPLPSGPKHSLSLKSTKTPVPPASSGHLRTHLFITFTSRHPVTLSIMSDDEMNIDEGRSTPPPSLPEHNSHPCSQWQLAAPYAGGAEDFRVQVRSCPSH